MDTKGLLKNLVTFKSLTPKDDGAFTYIKNLFIDFEVIEQEIEGVKNLFLYKKYGEGRHLCFAGHIDVVPSGEGWSSDPFIPLEKDGYIYGRGTQDMKSGVAVAISAILESSHKGTISLLLTSDEEGDGIYGTKEMLKLLDSKNLLPDMVIVAEPTSERKVCDTIKVGRRGSINGKLTLKGRQGHAAYPNKSDTPIDKIAPILPRIAGYLLDNGDDFFDPSRFTITDIRAGMEVSNVTPNELKMMFNVRNSTNTSLEDIRDFVKKGFDGCEYELDLKQGSFPFITNRDASVVQHSIKAIKNICGYEPTLSTSGGTSDARYFGGEYHIPVVEIGVVNDRIHAVDERVGIEELERLKDVYKELIRIL